MFLCDDQWSFKRFHYFNFEQIFWNTKTFLKKLEYHFSFETTKIENTTFPFKTTLSEANVMSFSSNYFAFFENLLQF